tara:strand:- start:39 stop:419 length:381 start_codon:yes stop_codon:yes gene_type:complete
MGMMPGQEKIIQEYYQKNPAALNSLRGSIYEEKIIEEIKKECKSNKKEITKEQAEKILKEENEKNLKKQAQFTKINQKPEEDLDNNKEALDSKKEKTTKSKNTKVSLNKSKTPTKKNKSTKRVSKK